MDCFRVSLPFRSISRAVFICGGALLLGRIAFSAVPSADADKKALCAYNLMQMGRAIQMFAEDHGGYICELNGRVKYAVENREPADNMQRLKAAYAPYIVDPEIWYCPNDPYARTHTLQPPDYTPPTDQPDMKYDHYYTSYRHYNKVRGEGAPPVRLDAIVVEQDEHTADLPGGVWVAGPENIMLMMDDGNYHGEPVEGEHGKVYGRNVLFRDGHVTFEVEETMRR